MTPRLINRPHWRWILPLIIATTSQACGSGSTSSTSGSKRGGEPCANPSECVSNVCLQNACVGNGQGAPAGANCTSGTDCASDTCSNLKCGQGSQLADGKSCTSPAECSAGVCTQGVCGKQNVAGGATSGSSTNVAVAAPFPGLGAAYRPLTKGCGPDTATQCGGTCENLGGDASAKVLREPAILCFKASSTSKVSDPTPDDPAALIEQVVESLNGVDYVHIRVTFDPAFADNTYGDNASAGWLATINGKTGKGHTFDTDLTKSDHVDLLLTDGTGKTVMELGEDYIHSLNDTAGPKPAAPKGDKPGPGPGPAAGPGAVAGAGGTSSQGTTTTTTTTTSADSACGFTNLGVTGGDGYMTLGSASHVLAATSSIYRNLKCGYCESAACSGTTGDGDCTVNSPKTDASYTPNPLTPNWNYDVVYEVWVSLEAFGSAGFGQAYVTYVHASPSKAGDNTLMVEGGPCPPSWNVCPPGKIDCWGTTAGSGGTSSGGSGKGTCETNFQMSVTLEGVSSCTPIPYANYPGMKACPDGYVLDTASEGRFCLPSS